MSCLQPFPHTPNIMRVTLCLRLPQHYARRGDRRSLAQYVYVYEHIRTHVNSKNHSLDSTRSERGQCFVHYLRQCTRTACNASGEVSKGALDHMRFIIRLKQLRAGQRSIIILTSSTEVDQSLWASSTVPFIKTMTGSKH